MNLWCGNPVRSRNHPVISARYRNIFRRGMSDNYRTRMPASTRNMDKRYRSHEPVESPKIAHLETWQYISLPGLRTSSPDGKRQLHPNPPQETCSKTDQLLLPFPPGFGILFAGGRVATAPTGSPLSLGYSPPG